MTIDGADLDRIKKYSLSGKPIVAIRTASHGFQNWLEMDRKVLGGNYKNHYGNKFKTKISINPKAKDHPILKGFEVFVSEGSLYRNTGLAKDSNVLLYGAITGHTEPIAWTRVFNGGRIFSTSLGHTVDFKNASFLRMLTNALYWTVKRQTPKPVAAP
jgi:type 1 glutamine amidotransferase